MPAFSSKNRRFLSLSEGVTVRWIGSLLKIAPVQPVETLPSRLSSKGSHRWFLRAESASVQTLAPSTNPTMFAVRALRGLLSMWYAALLRLGANILQDRAE
ncbi:hypothetical protein XH93_09400 [Bradyrhizobium sp. CCBAU 51753]|nr:hypothetical protein XH93_09400 [Bradyrhizobium sp. CCBAU 51753]